jgi:hypothetical protein
MSTPRLCDAMAIQTLVQQVCEIANNSAAQLSACAAFGSP